MQQLKLLQRLNAVDASVSLANLPSMSSQFVAMVNSNGNMARRLEGSATGVLFSPAKCCLQHKYNCDPPADVHQHLLVLWTEADSMSRQQMTTLT